jgi:cell division protein FtsI/penicillin-binding protein 2
VQITINLAIQSYVEQAIREQVAKSKPANIAAVVVRPTTGEIVAMASWPSFDPEDLRTLDKNTMRNNVLAFVYEPGSTFKPLVAGAAVAERLTTWSESIYCERGVWTCSDGRSKRTIHNSHMGNEMLTVTDGIAQSDNILMGKLGVRLGPQRLYKWVVDQFGFGRRFGVCLPGEDAGLVLPRKNWNVLGSCLSVPMGHEISVTPLQLAMAHATIANGGEWMPPRLVRRIYTIDEHGVQQEQAIPPLPQPRRIFSQVDAAQIQEAMTHTMSDTRGTGKRLQLDGYTSAGKTGTAEKVINGRYSKEHHVGSFVSWAPAEPGVRPELLCLVVTDDPSEGSHYGAVCAGPAVRDILQYSLEKVLRLPKRADLLNPDDDDGPAPRRVQATVTRRGR